MYWREWLVLFGIYLLSATHVFALQKTPNSAQSQKIITLQMIKPIIERVLQKSPMPSQINQEEIEQLRLASEQFKDIRDYLLLVLAQAYQQQQDYELAEKSIKQAQNIKTIPFFLKQRIQFTWVENLIYKKQEKEAQQELARFFESSTDPQLEMQLLYHIGQMEEGLKNKKDALNYYQKLMIDYPQFEHRQELEQQVDLLKDKKQDALSYAFDFNTERKRVQLLIRYGFLEEAQTRINQILQKNKTLDIASKSRFIYSLGMIAWQKKHPDICLEYTSFAIAQLGKQDPFREDVLKLKTRCLFAMQNFKEAAIAYEDIIHIAEKEKQGPKNIFDLKLIQAMAYKDAKDFETSDKLFETLEKNAHKSALLRDKHPDVLWFLGFSYFKRQDYDNAEKKWQQILEDYPQSDLILRVKYWMARLNEQQKKMQQALFLYAAVYYAAPWSYYGWLAQEKLIDLKAQDKLDKLNELPVLEPPQFELLDYQSVPDKRAQSLFLVGAKAEAILTLRQYPAPKNSKDAPKFASLLHSVQDFARNQAYLRIAFKDQTRSPYRQELTPFYHYLYPFVFDQTVLKEATEQHITPEFVYSIMRQESLYHPYAISSADAHGLMQILPKTARRIARDLNEKFINQLYQPEINIHYGVAYLARLNTHFLGHPALAAAAYNAGPANVEGWIKKNEGQPFDIFVEEIPYTQTRDYVKKVMANLVAYRHIYRQEATHLKDFVEPIPTDNLNLVDY